MITDIHDTTGHGIRQICVALRVPRSSYYHAAVPTASQLTDSHLGDLITEIFKRHRRRYGYRRIHSELTDQDITCAPDRVRRIMVERGLKALQPESYTPQTSDGRADKPSENLLLDQPHPEKSNQVWAGDITYIPTSDGWLYLAVDIDLCSRKIVGWAIADHMRSQLVTDALKQALGSRQIAPGLIPQRPRQPIRQHQLPPTPRQTQHASKHVRPRQPVSQRLDRILHGHAQEGNVGRRKLPKRDRRPPRTLRLHRELLQHASQTLSPELSNSDPV